MSVCEGVGVEYRNLRDSLDHSMMILYLVCLDVRRCCPSLVR